MTTSSKPRSKNLPTSVERRAWSIDEWRAMYGFGRNYTYELIADGVLPTVKLRRRRIITVEGDQQFRLNIGACA